MSFLNTEPVPILTQDEAGQWRRFLVGDPDRQRAWLHKISRGDVPVSLGQPPSTLLSVTLWSVDDNTRTLHFSAPITPQNEQAVGWLVSQPDAWAAAYVGDDKIQFQVRQLSAVMKGGRLMLSAEGPLVLYRLTRRQGLRVRRPPGEAPTARLAGAAGLSSSGDDTIPATLLEPVSGSDGGLRLANVSLQGCALRLPPGHPSPRPGQLLRQVEVELDEETILYADLVVQHVTSDFREPGAHLAGCLWGHMPTAARALLQKWIVNGRRRLDLVSLNFD
jgi:hypothetical protein